MNLPTDPQLIELELLNKEEKEQKIQAILSVLVEEKDRSKDARARRRKLLIRAVYGEFVCSSIFYSILFSYLAMACTMGITGAVHSFGSACVSGFTTIAVTYAFSSVSGAQVNPAVSFALWITGKSSNRRFICYLVVQFAASLVAVGFVTLIFNGDYHNIYNALMVMPRNSHATGAYFSTEFVLTFALTFVAFTVALEDSDVRKAEDFSIEDVADSKGLTVYATTPQSKAGFAPIAIGFTVICLSMAGGDSGGAFNPARIFGPAVASGHWKYLPLYWLAEFSGAAAAGLLSHYTAPTTQWTCWPEVKDSKHIERSQSSSTSIKSHHSNLEPESSHPSFATTMDANVTRSSSSVQLSDGLRTALVDNAHHYHQQQLQQQQTEIFTS